MIQYGLMYLKFKGELNADIMNNIHRKKLSYV